MRQPLRLFRWAVPLLAAVAAGCGGVQVKPDPALPKPLVQPIPTRAGLLLDGVLRNYKHEESRQGGNWSVDLGPGHVEMMESIFKATFGDMPVFSNLDEALATQGLLAIFQPQIEQYSFATARDTSGGYWAVTIRYRIGVLAPDGQQAESLAMTGYGSARDKGGSTKSLNNATLAAMRDASAKFLVQMPRQPVAAQLREGHVVQAGVARAPVKDEIELVPIEP